MVSSDISKCQATGIIRILTLACFISTFLLLGIDTVNCIASLTLSSSGNGFQASIGVTNHGINKSPHGNSSVRATSNGNTGKMIILILVNRRVKLRC
jgi:hypothetical protein